MSYATRTNPFVIQKFAQGKWVDAMPRGKAVRSGMGDDEAIEWFRVFCARRRVPHRLIQHNGMGAGRMGVLATHGDGGGDAERIAICPVALAIGGARALPVLTGRAVG